MSQFKGVVIGAVAGIAIAAVIELGIDFYNRRHTVYRNGTGTTCHYLGKSWPAGTDGVCRVIDLVEQEKKEVQHGNQP